MEFIVKIKINIKNRQNVLLRNHYFYNNNYRNIWKG